MNEVTDALAPIEDGQRAENCFLFGPSGAGKTTVARAAVRELRREVLDVPYACVNRKRDYTLNVVIERISRSPCQRGQAQNSVDAVAVNVSSEPIRNSRKYGKDFDSVDQLKSQVSSKIAFPLGSWIIRTVASPLGLAKVS